MHQAEYLLSGELVARQKALGEQVIGMDGIGCLGPSRQSAQPGKGGAQRTARVRDPRDHGTDDRGAPQPAGHLHRRLVHKVLGGLGPGALRRGGSLG